MKQNEKIEIPAENRPTGRHNNRVLRRDKKVPGVVYGPKIGNIPFVTEERVINRYLGHAFDNTIFTLTSTDSKLNNVAVMYKG
ncbi:MAG: hypothetical protein ABL958_08280, partial [Bdellovibrionia bacterium]